MKQSNTMLGESYSVFAKSSLEVCSTNAILSLALCLTIPWQHASKKYSSCLVCSMLFVRVFC